LKPYSLATLEWSCGYGFLITVKIRINGEEKEIAVGLSIGSLLESLGIRPGRVVVERNRQIVARDAYGLTTLAEGDALEIVHFVGGG
jgi:thiamine biosynthesis protein ThiS